MRDDSDYIRLDFRRGKVPIINAHSKRYDIQLDISVNKTDGLKQLF
jgi:DNA polymerase sigma